MKIIQLKVLTWVLFLSCSAVYAADPIYTPWHNNLAIKGYDSVAYFTQTAAIKGDSDYALEWQGATWLFSSDANKQLFESAPETYAPQYGGYCAYAVAKNDLAGIDPTQFTIHDGKLYLNYSKKVQAQWLQQKEQFITRANDNWPTVLND